MKYPTARGPLSSQLLDILREEPSDTAALHSATASAIAESSDILRDDDIQLALFCLYELHYRGLDGTDDRWEWHTGLLDIRAAIETAFELALRDRVVLPERPEPTVDAVAATLFAMAADDTGPGLSKFVARSATEDQLREFLVHRSVYQLKEADPHTWAIPRLDGRPKAALVEVQADEYGGGRAERMHSALFARTMRGLGLDDSFGAYVDEVPAITLASVNMMSLFGLHRRLRGAIVGHLAAFEMTSSVPNRFYGNGFRRLGFDENTTWYFDEHVEADAVHEQIAGRDLAGALVEAEPELLDDVLFGAAACLAVDTWVAEHVVDAWSMGASSLRSQQPELPVSA